MKIGFCFLIKQYITYPELWLPFFDGHEDEYGIYIHCKRAPHGPGYKGIQKTGKGYPGEVLPGDVHLLCRSTDLSAKAKIASKLINTKWGGSSLVQATISLFEDAYNDGCDYIILVSGDMIPLCSFEQLKSITDSTAFTSPEREIMNRWQEGRMHRRYYGPRNHQVSEIVPEFRDYKKQNMFFGITAKDYKSVNWQQYFDKYFTNYCCPDEHFWINILSALNIEYNNTNFVHVSNDVGSTQARSWTLTDKLIDDTECYFIRKVHRGIEVDVLDRMKQIYKTGNNNL